LLCTFSIVYDDENLSKLRNYSILDECVHETRW
jgi:hypothetical protein